MRPRRHVPRRSSAVAVLHGKKRRQKSDKSADDSTNWFDDGEQGEREDSPAPSASTPTAGFDAGIQGGNIPSDNSIDGEAAAPLTDDSLLLLDGNNRGPEINMIADEHQLEQDEDDGKIVLEPVWVEGQTDGEKPIVETFGLDAAAAEDDEINIDIDGLASYGDATAGSATAVIEGGLGLDGVGPETWRNGMDVPDDDFLLGEGMKMGRGLDDMLMERSIRFYDPKVRACYKDGRAYSMLHLHLLLLRLGASRTQTMKMTPLRYGRPQTRTHGTKHVPRDSYDDDRVMLFEP